jgi:ferric-dicitrate binding protein FerR (iron transport regulator)
MRVLVHLILAGWLAGLAAAQAQPAGCSAEPSTNATQTLRCGGVTIVVEAGADFVVLDRNRDGQIDAVELRSKAVLVDAPKQRKGNRFEVITPQAIAAVRGTQWAVDAEGAKTSVFVVGGSVGVRRRGGPGRVVLGAGEGVDVEPGRAPLTVRRWPQPRVDALLARLGR